MRYSVVRCDECGRDEWLIFPKRYPDGWRRKPVNESETWDLCCHCTDQAINGDPVKRVGERNRETVAKLLKAAPDLNDQELAIEALRWGIQISGETVRRHRIALGVPKASVRRRGLTEAVFLEVSR